MGNSRENHRDQAGELALAARFESFELFRESIGGWDLDFRQMDRGAFEARLSQVVTPSVILTRCGLNRRIDQVGSSPPGYRTFGIPMHDAVEVRWRSRSLSGQHLMLFPPCGELDSVSMPGFDVITVSVSESLMDEAMARRGLPHLEELFSGTYAIHYPGEQRRALREKAALLTESASINPTLLRSMSFRSELEHELVECLLDAMGAGHKDIPKPMARQRARILKRALGAITDHAHEPLTVAELQQLSGTSMRTLRYAFTEQFGLSPKQYLQAYRLGQVRRLLRQPESSDTVADAANAWGFWHMGQFAADYRKMFGELPGETLQRHHQHRVAPGRSEA